MASDLVLIDSSAWIAFFREPNSPAADLVDQLLDQERAAIVNVVRAELLQGTRSEAEFERLGRLLDAVERLEEPDDLWDRVARLGFDLRRSGVNGIGVPDLLIAVIAVAGGVPLLTLDTDFQRIANVRPLTLLAPRR